MSYTQDGLRKAIRKIGEKTGRYSLRYHDLCHEASTIMEEVSNNIYAAQAISRHKRVAATQKYTHIFDERIQKAVKNVNDYYLGTLKAIDPSLVGE